VSVAQNIHTLLIPSQPRGFSRSNPLPLLYHRNLQAPRTTGEFCNIELTFFIQAQHGPGGRLRPFSTRDDKIMGFWLTRATQSNPIVTQSHFEFFVNRLLPGHTTVEGHPTVTGHVLGSHYPNVIQPQYEFFIAQTKPSRV
jgi:hypothetical protein